MNKSFGAIVSTHAAVFLFGLAIAVDSYTPLDAADEDAGTARRLGERLSTRFASLGTDSTASKPVLRLVYFHGADSEPLADHVERWGRILDDVRAFYRDGMAWNGFGPLTFDYERDASGQPLFHVVRGRHPSARYSYDTGREIREEARDAIGAKFDFGRSYTLFVHGLCDGSGVGASGEYRIHAPYYGEGWSDWQAGMCHVADCPVLDPNRLNETEARIRYWEHTGRFNQTIADFNTKYLGGVAHELGHGFGLPHNRESKAERAAVGTALMGSGNHTYRREVWSKRRGSFLSLASAISLAGHPLFRGYANNHAAKSSTDLQNVRFDAESDPPTFAAKMTSQVEPIAVIAYADPAGGSNYDAQTAVAEVRDGTFEVPLVFDRLSDGQFRVVACLANGAVRNIWTSRLDTVEGKIDVRTMQSRIVLRELEQQYFGGDRKAAVKLTKQLCAGLGLNRFADFFCRISESETAQRPVSLSDVREDHVWLGDAAWASAKVGWMRPARNHYAGRPGNEPGRFISIEGQPFATGLYAHAPSRFVFQLDGKWTTFQTSIGFQDGGQSTAVWSVIGDGRPLLKSNPLKPGQREQHEIDVSGVDQLELVIGSTLPTNGQCWTVWGDPQLSR